jgi:equilibrative nucleoside transporter 1/2/3
LTFNFTALIGTFLSTYFSWVKLFNFLNIFFHLILALIILFFFQPNAKWLYIPVTLRVVLIPLFLVCNYQPLGVTRIMPVLIKNDYIFWMLGAILGLSSGYYSSVAMMYTPR